MSVAWQVAAQPHCPALCQTNQRHPSQQTTPEKLIKYSSYLWPRYGQQSFQQINQSYERSEPSRKKTRFDTSPSIRKDRPSSTTNENEIGDSGMEGPDVSRIAALLAAQARPRMRRAVSFAMRAVPPRVCWRRGLRAGPQRSRAQSDVASGDMASCT